VCWDLLKASEVVHSDGQSWNHVRICVITMVTSVNSVTIPAMFSLVGQ
jgi:hypothetical protein